MTSARLRSAVQSEGVGSRPAAAPPAASTASPPFGRRELVIGGATLVALLILTATFLEITSAPHNGPNSCDVCGGPQLSVGTPMRTVSAAAPSFCASVAGISDWCDSIAVGSVGGGLTASELDFAIWGANETPVHFTVGTPAIHLESANGGALAAYSFASRSWTFGSATSLNTTQTFVLDLGGTVSGPDRCSPLPTGELFVALASGSGSFTGQVRATLD